MSIKQAVGNLAANAKFGLPVDSRADENAVVRCGPARFSVLTTRLIRLEYQNDGNFSDQASQVFWHRHQPVPAFTTRRVGQWTVIETEHLVLRYADGQPFTAETLTITLKESGVQWRYGDEDWSNLRGTARTLDQVSGATKLEPGLLSRAGWALVDDSASLLFMENGWLEPRRHGGLDAYFFGYGHDYRACLADFTRLAGPVPMPPRWALGNWWSRYWTYTQKELEGVIREFQEHQVPLSVCVIDMDWHLTNVPNPVGKTKGAGWTGYTWNRDLFPDPDGFIAWLRAQGLKTALNLHPADGVQPHEARYPEMARRLGIDPETRQPVPFDIADPAFASAYFEVLHHPEEARGVDFWWMDWQQERTTRLPGLDPLWWLNHLHFYDLARDGRKRPFLLSRWGGLGNHRYPIGFSGDTHVDWPSLAFQPAFTATAANVGYGWWSHDIGGHGSGVEEGELYARWVQFGLFSPILRLHSSKNPFHERRPWGFDAEVERVASEALRWRHAFIPYVYSMAWLNYCQGLALVQPLYHDYPEVEDAYTCPQEYLFGTELIVAPIVSRAHPETLLVRQKIWLPDGDWYHFFTGERYTGGRQIVVYSGLRDIPVFAKAGAVVPLGPKAGWGGLDNPVELHIHLFAGQDGRFLLYEDDGETTGYVQGQHAQTLITHHWEGGAWRVTLHPTVGDVSLIPPERQVTFHCHGIREPERVTLTPDGQAVTTHCDAVREVMEVRSVTWRPAAGLELALSSAGAPLRAARDRSEEKYMAQLRAFHLPALTKRSLAREWASIRAAPELLEKFTPTLTEAQRRALLDVMDAP